MTTSCLQNLMQTVEGVWPRIRTFLRDGPLPVARVHIIYRILPNSQVKQARAKFRFFF